MTGWTLADPESARDLATFLHRAGQLDPGGACRIVGVGKVAAVYVCAFHGAGTVTVLGLRTLALAEPSTLDAVVPISAVSDRLAHPQNGLTLPVPPQTITAPWAGVLPPRSGWRPVGLLDQRTLHEVARNGVAEVASGAPEGSGSAAVTRLRTLVWGRDLPYAAVPEPTDAGPDATDRPSLTAAVGLAAQRLGFLSPAVGADPGAGDRQAGRPGSPTGPGPMEPVPVHTAGAWTRVSCPGGFVLSRRPLI
ncbi:MAG: hypothetical protein ACK5MT_03300 [Actinomycetales bacterium]